MGVMSKGNQRLSERPLPPSTAERDDDIQSVDDADVVFSLGQKYLTDYYEVSPSSTPTNESLPPNTSSSGSTSTTNTSPNNTSLNTSNESELSQEQVKESYDDVVRLMSLYSSLKQVPLELEGKYSTLKCAADELSGSISELRAISLNFGVNDSSDSKVGRVKKDGGKTKTRKKH